MANGSSQGLPSEHHHQPRSDRLAGIAGQRLDRSASLAIGGGDEMRKPKTERSRHCPAAPLISLVGDDQNPLGSSFQGEDSAASIHEQARALEAKALEAWRFGHQAPGPIGFNSLALSAHYSNRLRAMMKEAGR